MTLARHDIGVAGPRPSGAPSGKRAADGLSAALSMLERMAADPAMLDTASLARRPGGYARTLLSGDGDASVWAIVWDAGARTSVHDHHCSCCFAVLAGELCEASFRAVGEGTAVAVAETRLGPGAVRCMLPSGPNLHQMVNRGTAEAISIHVYGFDPRTAPSSVHREYRAVPQ